MYREKIRQERPAEAARHTHAVCMRPKKRNGVPESAEPPRGGADGVEGGGDTRRLKGGKLLRGSDMHMVSHLLESSKVVSMGRKDAHNAFFPFGVDKSEAETQRGCCIVG